MGNVIFNTDVDKTVNIDKNVNYDVIKNVDTNVNLRGSLASAEASADAVGGFLENGDGEEVIVRRTVDNFTQDQLLTVNPPPPLGDSGPLLLNGASTDIPPPTFRTLFTEVLSSPEGLATIAVNDVEADKLTFGQDPGTYSNSYAEYEGGPFDPFDGADSNQDILDDFNVKLAEFAGGIYSSFNDIPLPLRQAFLDTVAFSFRFEDATWDVGQGDNGQAATLRVSLLVGDTTTGDYAITTVLFVPGLDNTGFQNLDVNGLVAAFIDPSIFDNGTVLDIDTDNGARIVLLGTDDDVDGDGTDVDFNQLDYFQILLEDDPTEAIGVNDGSLPGAGPFSSSNFFGVDSVTQDETGFTFAENFSVDGSDASVGNFTFTDRIVREGGGRIAETETFAQVTEDGSYAFSNSLAAFSGSVTDQFIL